MYVSMSLTLSAQILDLGHTVSMACSSCTYLSAFCIQFVKHGTTSSGPAFRKGFPTALGMRALGLTWLLWLLDPL